MNTLVWLLPPLTALAFGHFYVKFLTVHPLKMSRYLLAACVALFATLCLVWAGFNGVARLPVSGLSLLSVLLAYTVTARQFFAREDTRPVPELTRTMAGHPGSGHTAVIYFTHGEPETYDPIGWINQFREFDEQGIPFIPFFARPFFIHKLRKKYLQIGKSDHHKMHQQMIKSLEQSFRAAGDETTKFYLCFLDDEPRPDAAVIQALNDGASQIIVLELFLTISNHTAEGKELIQHLSVDGLGVPIRYTGPMYDSQTLKRMFVQRANAHIGDTDKSKVGILLVGHGQPDEWDVEWGSETEGENSFREDILDMLVEDGYRRENLSLAWMAFKEPKPAATVEAYVAKGMEKILYFPAAISADAIHSQYDIPELIELAKIPDGFPVLNMRAWNDDPMVIQAMVEKITAQMDGFTNQMPTTVQASVDKKTT